MKRAFPRNLSFCANRGKHPGGARCVGRPVRRRFPYMSAQWKAVLGVGCALLYWVLVTLPAPAGLPPSGQKALAIMVVAIVAWIFEVLPIGMSSALFVMILPLLKVLPMKDAMASFAIPTIFFILSSFVLVIGFTESGLARRLSLLMSGLLGTKPSNVLLSFMASTALVSTVVADIPTSLIFASIALPLLANNDCLPGASNFGKALMMGIPIASAIGGIGTPAGSGLNVLALSLLKSSANVDVNFLEWSVIGLPTAAVLTVVAWYVLVKMFPPELDDVK